MPVKVLHTDPIRLRFLLVNKSGDTTCAGKAEVIEDHDSPDRQARPDSA